MRSVKKISRGLSLGIWQDGIIFKKQGVGEWGAVSRKVEEEGAVVKGRRPSGFPRKLRALDGEPEKQAGAQCSSRECRTERPGWGAVLSMPYDFHFKSLGFRAERAARNLGQTIHFTDPHLTHAVHRVHQLETEPRADIFGVGLLVA